MPKRKAAATCDAPDHRSARLTPPPKLGQPQPSPSPAPAHHGSGRGGAGGRVGHERGAAHLDASAAVVARVAVATAVAAAAAAAAAVAASAAAAAAAAAATPSLVGSGQRAVAGGRSARGGGGQEDTCTREGGARVRQREGAQARPLGADGVEGRRAGRSPAMHPRHRRRQTNSWRRERLPGAIPPLGDYPRPRRPHADGGPKPGGLIKSIMRE